MIAPRIIGDSTLILVALDEVSEDDENPENESQLTDILKQGSDNKPGPDITIAVKVELLIGRMDQFMNCCATLHTTVSKNQRVNDKKFKRLETAHNDLAVKMASSTSSNRNKIEQLESQLKVSLSSNAVLAKRITSLEEDLTKTTTHQRQVNDHQSKLINEVKVEKGFTNRTVIDCYAEVKERKVIISGVAEFPGENTTVVALGCINKIIEAAIKAKHPDAHLEGLRKLQYDSIDKAFRLGKAGKNRKRNIEVTLMRTTDRDMIFRAKSDLKEEDGVKFYLNDDVAPDGRILKAKLRRIMSVAKAQGRNAKLLATE